QDYLDRIRGLTEDCDDMGIEELLDELSAYRIPDGEKERIHKIREALDMFDFDGIMEALG
ncbi:MAG: hypothetical protein VZQ83_10240, partial [Eubacterium sp.]|nr:hypothetical protein [Eubacterium sp.]